MFFYTLVLGTEGFVMALLATSLPGGQSGEGLAVGMSTCRVTCKKWVADWVRREINMLPQKLSLR